MKDIYTSFLADVDRYVESLGLSIFLNSRDRDLRIYLSNHSREQIIKDLEAMKAKGIHNIEDIITELIKK